MKIAFVGTGHFARQHAAGLIKSNYADAVKTLEVALAMNAVSLETVS